MQTLTPDEIDQIIQLFDDPNTAKWDLASSRVPETLLALIALFERRLAKEGAIKAGLAEKLIAELSLYMGGRHLYIPNGDRLKRAIRDIHIYQMFNGRNTEDVASHFGMTERNINNIILKINQRARKNAAYLALNKAKQHG